MRRTAFRYFSPRRKKPGSDREKYGGGIKSFINGGKNGRDEYHVTGAALSGTRPLALASKIARMEIFFGSESGRPLVNIRLIICYFPYVDTSQI